ncbi:hypothetical protein [Streptomyces syringium]|uniref:hypothetical protein n=1 Tax=Streptomyces syringium TaxID=76729 RepID=UPI00345202C9
MRQGEGNVQEFLNAETLTITNPVVELDQPPYSLSGGLALSERHLAAVLTFTVRDVGSDDEITQTSITLSPVSPETDLPVNMPCAQEIIRKLNSNTNARTTGLSVICDMSTQSNMARVAVRIPKSDSLPAAEGSFQVRFPGDGGEEDEATPVCELDYASLIFDFPPLTALSQAVAPAGIKSSDIPSVLSALKPTTVKLAWGAEFSYTRMAVEGTLTVLDQQDCPATCFFRQSSRDLQSPVPWEIGGTLRPQGSAIQFTFDYTKQQGSGREIITLSADATAASDDDTPALPLASIGEIHNQPFMGGDHTLNVATGVSLPSGLLPEMLSLDALSLVYDLTNGRTSALAATISCTPELSFIPGTKLESMCLSLVAGRDPSGGAWQYSGLLEANGVLGPRDDTDAPDPPYFSASARFPDWQFTLQVADPGDLADFDTSHLNDVQAFSGTGNPSNEKIRLRDLNAVYTPSTGAYSIDLDLATPFAIGEGALQTSLNDVRLTLDKDIPESPASISLEASAFLAGIPTVVAVSRAGQTWTIEGTVQPGTSIDQFKNWLKQNFDCSVPLLDDLGVDLVHLSCRTGQQKSLAFTCLGQMQVFEHPATYSLDITKAIDWTFQGTLTVPTSNPDKLPLVFTVDSTTGTQGRLTATWADPVGVTIADLIPQLPEFPLIGTIAPTQARLTYEAQHGHAVTLSTNTGGAQESISYVSLAPAS